MVDPSWDGGFSRLAAADMKVLYQPDYLDMSQMSGLTPRNVRDLNSRACANQRWTREIDHSTTIGAWAWEREKGVWLVELSERWGLIR